MATSDLLLSEARRLNSLPLSFVLIILELEPYEYDRDKVDTTFFF